MFYFVIQHLAFFISVFPPPFSYLTIFSLFFPPLRSPKRFMAVGGKRKEREKKFFPLTRGTVLVEKHFSKKIKLFISSK